MFKRLAAVFKRSFGPSAGQLKEAYILGSDESEYGRLALQSKLFDLYFDAHRYEFIPFTPKRILDLNCGAGQYTWNLAIGYPDSQIVAVDRDAKAIEDARQHFSSRTNVQFIIGDIQEEFPPGLFDLITDTLSFWPLKSPQTVLRFCYQSLRPGGYLWLKEEYQADQVVPQHPDMIWFYKQEIRLGDMIGLTPALGDRLKLMVQEAGFTDVRTIPEVYEAHGVSGASGAALDNLILRCVSAASQYVKFLNVSQAEIDERIKRLREAQKSGELHGHFSLINVIARKPAGTARLQSPY